MAATVNNNTDKSTSQYTHKNYVPFFFTSAAFINESACAVQSNLNHLTKLKYLYLNLQYFSAHYHFFQS